MPLRILLALLGLLLAVPAYAQTAYTFRMAAIAPDGTAWARELKAFARDVDKSTDGMVQMKWYLGAIAGDEVAAVERVRRGQLDGTAGALFCEKLSPTLRVTRLVGLIDNRELATYVLARLRPIIDEEFSKAGFVNLGVAGFGNDLLFTRRPVASMEDLRRQRMWVWDLDKVFRAQIPLLGVTTVPLPVENAAKAFENNTIDGFIGVPTAALAFQWSADVRYYTDLRLGYIPACIVVSHHAFDNLPYDTQKAVREAGAKLQVRFEDVGRTQDESLVGHLFMTQGLRRVAVSPKFRAQFEEAAAVARDKMADRMIPRALLKRVVKLVDEYHKIHSGKE